MPYITVGRENSADIELYYEDHGAGRPVVLIHGFPLSGASWEKQLPVLLGAGYRVITYDRRGFGRSSRPVTGYDYDTFTEDLSTVMEMLDLQDAVLAGFSMGTGEVTRYLGNHGSRRVGLAVLVAPVPPYLLKADDNPAGVDQSVFDGIMRAAFADRPAYLTAFLDDFNNTDKLGGTRISEQALRMQWNVAADASAHATLACVPTWLTDFRDDLPKNDVPTLVVQGDEDRILPIDSTGRRLPDLIPDSRLVEIPGGPHNIGWTHAEELNTALMGFLDDHRR
ncbi:Non-heme chloroperoxidase [Streptomyces sp. ADI92-24]|uniref:alpha/beta fold hydrolase n=1 Tax=unclassified Streptomyces TaxID=2593676 RepID=UPI000F471904|nr:MULTISPECIES: alpha/beta hydrolase [unclassified Streptomyces]MCX4768871.1 alpha/beta hydrolase [Streptomyces sp. NBC_01285]ROQ76969.1 non-heme chloroperoxidase [Streptomyces sp. CEV 2-1]RPK40868.1 Non-heme chloroperoxidase [Streptomyces sp. ADI92-24]